MSIEIPEYLTRVKLSEKRRKIYFKRGKKIPKKYLHFPFDQKGFLVYPDSGERVVKNALTAGTPRWLTLSGNWFYASPQKHTRALAIKEVKRFFRRALSKMEIAPLSDDAYPLRVEWEFHAPVGVGNWDLDNLWFYQKCFLDTLVKMGVLRDDTIEYITAPGRPEFYPVEKEEDRKFVFRFYKDDRACITNHEFWQRAA